jgi:hypothetical protein
MLSAVAAVGGRSSSSPASAAGAQNVSKGGQVDIPGAGRNGEIAQGAVVPGTRANAFLTMPDSLACLPDEFDLTRPPFLGEEGFERAIESQDHEGATHFYRLP